MIYCKISQDPGFNLNLLGEFLIFDLYAAFKLFSEKIPVPTRLS